MTDKISLHKISVYKSTKNFFTQSITLVNMTLLFVEYRIIVFWEILQPEEWYAF